MSISSSNTETKRCRHCNAEMVKLVSKSERNLGRSYWKCFRTNGATRCSGYEWVTAANTPNESDILNQVDVKELNAYAELPISLQQLYSELQQIEGHGVMGNLGQVYIRGQKLAVFEDVHPTVAPETYRRSCDSLYNNS
ncbi:hypothetical protein L3X38_017816 [Prunus dulcis]|uniref:GRF-type domain-containing protein n=1 Tax=Prunus dulcis TaxID=3755 RepID=A0AAD4ZA55_PRUDU|nr:hypothetical protein L3X38_017816 [Prunus dulcis]